MEGKVEPKKSKIERIIKRESFQGKSYDDALRSTRSFYDETANGYVEFYENWIKKEGSFSDKEYRKGYDTVAELLGSIVKPNERIIDVGCGVGVWSLLMAKKGLMYSA